jgi:hypothetical protein
MPRTKTAKAIPLMVRLPPELHAQVVEAAQGRNVSLNEFIVSALSDRLNSDEPALDQRLTELERRIQVVEMSLVRSSAEVYPPEVRFDPGE